MPPRAQRAPAAAPSSAASSVAASKAPSRSTAGKGQGKGGKIRKKSTSKKQFFDPNEAIQQGLCGFEGCGEAVDGPPDSDSISCADHHETFVAGYGYLGEDVCQKKYGEEPEFADSFDNAHRIVHENQTEKDFPVGSVDVFKGNSAETHRDYGCWNLSAPFFYFHLGSQPKSS